MKKRLSLLRYLLVLLPLGLFIRFVDLQVFAGFLGSDSPNNHYIYIAGLLVVAACLIGIILYIDQSSNKGDQ